MPLFEESLASLGTGGTRDRLGFRLVVAILLRCLPLLREVRWPLAGFVAAWAVLGLISFALVVGVIAVWWNSVLGDAPLAASQAALLGLDPLHTVAVERLTDAMRREVAKGVSLAAVLLAPLLAVGFSAVFYLQVWILQRINQTLRVRLVERLQLLSLRFHAESRVGDALYRTYQDSAMVTQLLNVLFLTPLGSMGAFGAGIAGVALFDLRLAALLLLVWPPMLLLGRFVSRRLRVGFRAARETNSALTSRIQETLSGIRVIKAYGLERFEQGRFERDSLRSFERAYAARSLLAVFGTATYWVVALGTLGALLQATLAAQAGTPLFAFGALQGSGLWAERALAAAGLSIWTLGLYNAFKFLFGNGTGATESLFRLWGRAQDIAIGLDRVFELLDLEPEVRDAPGAVELDGFRSSVSFEDVTFGYAPERPVLEEVRLEAKPGTVTAIVGPTGAGKSTLLALLLRLFDPQRGRIAIDGVDLRAIRIASLRARIAIALQENILFGTTVRENIRYAVPEASEAAVRAAARVACADEFIERLPRGYDTLLGERGAKLSSGQRQRLSIARAILKEAPILILDEPTSALDAETELRVLRNLGEWGRGRVILLITHRLSAIRLADQIACLEAGRLVERGTHEELLRVPNGRYRRLVAGEERGLPRAEVGA